MNLLLSVLQNKVKIELYDKTFTHPDSAEYTNIDRFSIFVSLINVFYSNAKRNRFDAM